MSKSCSSGYPKRSVCVEGEKSITTQRPRKSLHHRLRAGIRGSWKETSQGPGWRMLTPQSSFSSSLGGGDIDTVPSGSMGFLSPFGLTRPFPVSAFHQSWFEETKAVP